MGQAYTDENLPGILNDIKIIYGKIEDAKLPKDQADAVVAKIASDMNRTSVPEVMKNLEQYVPKKGTGANNRRKSIHHGTAKPTRY
jgi:hypothetical protein